MARRGDGIYLRGRLTSRPPKRKPERPVDVVEVRHPGLAARGEKS